MRLAEGAADDRRQSPGSGRDRLAGQVRLQVSGQRRRAWVAKIGRLLQALERDQLEVAVDPRIQQVRRQRLLLQHQEDRIERRSGLERRPAGEHLVEDRSQAVDVAGRSDPASPDDDLFGRHVAGRSDDGARGSEAGIRRRAAWPGRSRPRAAGPRDRSRCSRASGRDGARPGDERNPPRGQSGPAKRPLREAGMGPSASRRARDWPSMSLMMKYGCPS